MGVGSTLTPPTTARLGVPLYSLLNDGHRRRAYLALPPVADSSFRQAFLAIALVARWCGPQPALVLRRPASAPLACGRSAHRCRRRAVAALSSLDALDDAWRCLEDFEVRLEQRSGRATAALDMLRGARNAKAEIQEL